MILDHTQNMLFRMQNIKHYIYNPYMEWGIQSCFIHCLCFNLIKFWIAANLQQYLHKFTPYKAFFNKGFGPQKSSHVNSFVIMV